MIKCLFVVQILTLCFVNSYYSIMNKNWILVVDSGMGGQWTLKKIQSILPNENYVFLMDKTNAPYGNKSKKKLIEIADNNIKKLLRIFDIKLVVLACNTLSSTCYDYLQQKYFNLPFVKIEPYFEPSLFNNNPTLLLATKSTIKNNKKIGQYKNHQNIFFKGFGKLAKKIDECCGNYDLLQNYLYCKLKRYRKRNIKNVILGCTHYNFIKNQIASVFDNDIRFFENSDKVAKKVYNILKFSGKKNRSSKMGELLILQKI